MNLTNDSQLPRFRVRRAALIFTLMGTCAVPAFGLRPASAQQSAVPAGIEDIVVTARKRQESILKAPVVMQALSVKDIENLKITNAYDLGAVTPGLIVNYAFASVGASVFMRGIGQGSTITFGDQSVLLNVDGAALPHGAFYKTGLFDIGQIEVLKGPQALFFGKSASAGIVAITSADPTETWKAKVSAGYEFEADETLVDGYISGPITDKLGIRLAGFASDMKGWLINPAPSVNRRIPDAHEAGGRLTLKFEDRDIGLRTKLKVSHAHVFTRLLAHSSQGLCSYGIRQLPALRADDCTVNNTASPVADGLPYNPSTDWYAVLGNAAAFASGSPFPLAKDGKPYGDTKSTSIILNADYDFTDSLTLTSVSSYAKLDAKESDLYGTASGYFESNANFKQLAYSQELRVTSNFRDSWLNFIAGGQYDSLRQNDDAGGSFPAFTIWNETIHKYKSENYSAFGQVILTPIDKWELTAGLRYTDVRKAFTQVLYTTQSLRLTDYTAAVPNNLRTFKEDATTPEFTLSYKPTDDLTAFISYKEGYKGPGSNANLNPFAAYTPTSNNIVPFSGEKVKGVEGGLKGKLFDNQVAFGLTGYHFKYTGLQVGFLNPANFTILVSNAANAKTQGVEADVTYKPASVAGLALKAFVAYDNARYTRFNLAPCWVGQTVAEGCGATTARAQDLTGKHLTLAPVWTGYVGADYETDVMADYKVALTTRLNFSSSYIISADQNPTGKQASYATFDASLRFGPASGWWDLGLIGKNLGNKYYIVAGGPDGSVRPSVIAGNANPRGDLQVHVARGRQLMLQLTVRPEF